MHDIGDNVSCLLPTCFESLVGDALVTAVCLLS